MDYLQTDEREDAVCSVELCVELLPRVVQKVGYWKWILASAHSAVQGALVCVLSGSAGVGCLDDRSSAAMIDYFERSRVDQNCPKPKTRMADFLTLVKRARMADWMSEFGGKPLVLQDGEFQDLILLNKLRRDFIHFEPKGWSIELGGLPRVLLNATNVIEFCLLRHPSGALRIDEAQHERLKSALNSVRQEATKVAAVYTLACI